jgi:hypothetical protein
VTDALAVKINIGLGVDGYAVDGLGGHGQNRSGLTVRADRRKTRPEGRINQQAAILGHPATER